MNALLLIAVLAPVIFYKRMLRWRSVNLAPLAREGSSDETPLLCALRRADTKRALNLIALGQDLQTVGGEDRLAPIHVAADYHSEDGAACLEALFSAKVDVNQRDRWGQSALHRAASGRWEWAARRLVEAGSDLEARDAEGLTPFLIAVQSGPVEMITLLARLGADVKAKSALGADARAHMIYRAGDQGAAVAALMEVEAEAEAREIAAALAAPAPPIPTPTSRPTPGPEAEPSRAPTAESAPRARRAPRL